MTMLNGTLALHDIPDVEQHCHSVIAAATARWAPRLNPHDHEDLLTYLIGETWIASNKYDPTQCSSFKKYTWALLALRVQQWSRDTNGDKRPGRKGPHPTPVNLDADTLDRLVGPQPGQPTDPPGMCPPDLARILGI